MITTFPALSPAARRMLAALLLVAGPTASPAAPVNWTNAAVGTWSVAGNWNPGVPGIGDDVFFGKPTTGVATSTGTINVDVSPVINTLTLSDDVATAVNWTFNNTSTNGAQTLTLNSGINYTSASNHNINGGSGANTLSVVLGGNNIWNIDRNATPSGSQFSGFSMNASVAGNFSITKTGFRALTLSGNNTFNGFVIKRGTVFTAGFTASFNPLGSGSVTFANDAAGPNNEGISLSINSGVSRTFNNDFVNQNANASQVASISIGNLSSHHVQTYRGNFTTGVGYNAAQFLNLSANGSSIGTSEGTNVFSGDWSGYAAGATFNGIRVNSSGTIRLDTISSVAPTNYIVNAADTSASAKLLFNFNGNQTITQTLSFTGAANNMRNSVGTGNTTAGTSTTLAGDVSGAALILTDNDGANLFAKTAGTSLTVSGTITGASTGKLRLNDGFTETTASTVNTLQLPTGTIALQNGSNIYGGGTDVVRGTLLATNATGSATGTGQITVGVSGAAVTGQAGVNAASSKIITGVTTATALTLQIGQSITGTGIPANSVITGITLGSTGVNSVISIDKVITTANATTVAFATTAYSTTAVLGGTGRLEPTGTNGLLVNPGSAVTLLDALTDSLDVALTGTGNADFASGAVFNFDLNTPGTSDSLTFTGLADTSAVAFNNNTINFTNLGGLGAGLYTLFTFDTPGKYTGTLTPGTGLAAYPGSSLLYNANDIQLNVVPEPSTTLLGSLALMLGLKRRRASR